MFQVKMEKKLLPIVELEHLSSHPVFSGVHVARSLVFCLVFCRSLFVRFGLFLLAIVLSILQFTTFNFSFGIFKLFLPIVLYLITYKVKVKCFIACYHLLVLLI